MVELLPTMYKALDLIPSSTKTKQTKYPDCRGTVSHTLLVKAYIGMCMYSLDDEVH